MLQVDLFICYAAGVLFSISAARQIKQKPERLWWDSKYFTIFLLLLIVFMPTGIYNFWDFGPWETMQVWETNEDIPAIVVFLFLFSNSIPGILGYYVGYKLGQKGKYHTAYLHVVLGFFLFWFVLFHGWDGTGYQRTLYDNFLHPGEPWEPGKTDGFAWFGGRIGITLMIWMPAIALAIVLYSSKWAKEGAQLDDSIPEEEVPGVLKLMINELIIVFGFGLGFAIITTFICNFFTAITGGTSLTSGWSIIGLSIGLPLFFIPIWYFGLKKGMPLSSVFKNLYIEEPGEVKGEATGEIMSETEQERLFQTFKAVISSTIDDKKGNPQNIERLNNFKGKINIGLHVQKKFYLWVHLIAENGNFELGKGKLDEYDLQLISDPEDMMYFANGQNSVLHMMFKKNRFGYRKLRFKGGTTGMNLGMLLKLPKILVLDKQQ